MRKLTDEQIRRGIALTTQWQALVAAAAAISDAEKNYINELRTQYGLDPSWRIDDWLDGFVTGVSDDNANN